MRTPDTLTALVDHGIIDEVLRPLMSGKEAHIYLVESGGEQRVAKIYKEANNRSFQNRADYTEGRKVRNSRDQRAMGSRSKHGKAQNEAAWKSAEVDMIYRLRDAGVRVPVPYHFIDGVLIMELVTDAEGFPAPRLGDLTLEPEEATEVFNKVLAEVVRMLCAGVVHGDLSDFNVLMSADGPVVIDFPQAVDASSNANAKKLLLRDVDNLHRFHAKWAPGVEALPYAQEMWDLYSRNALTPDTKLSGKFRTKQKVVSTEDVLDLIADADKDERRRREGLGIAMRGHKRGNAGPGEPGQAGSAYQGATGREPPQRDQAQRGRRDAAPAQGAPQHARSPRDERPARTNFAPPPTRQASHERPVRDNFAQQARPAGNERPARDFAQQARAASNERPAREHFAQPMSRDERPAREQSTRQTSRDERPAREHFAQPTSRDERPAREHFAPPTSRDERPAREHFAPPMSRDERPASRDDRSAPRDRSAAPAQQARHERPASRERPPQPAPRQDARASGREPADERPAARVAQEPRLPARDDRQPRAERTDFSSRADLRGSAREQNNDRSAPQRSAYVQQAPDVRRERAASPQQESASSGGWGQREDRKPARQHAQPARSSNAGSPYQAADARSNAHSNARSSQARGATQQTREPSRTARPAAQLDGPLTSNDASERGRSRDRDRNS